MQHEQILCTTAARAMVAYVYNTTYLATLSVLPLTKIMLHCLPCMDLPYFTAGIADII